MSYPPQQPGPQGPYGNNPHGSDPYGHQSGGFPQQPGEYPPQSQQFGGYGQQAQPGQYGQPDQFPQPGQYWPPPGPYGPQGFGAYPGGGAPPARKKTGLFVGLGIGAVVVATVLVTGLAWPGWMVGIDRNEPKSVAEAYAEAYQDSDLNGVTELICGKVSARVTQALRKELDDIKNIKNFTARVNGEPKINGDTGTVPVQYAGDAAGEHRTKDSIVRVRRKDGEWCLDVRG
ncbi:MAG: hypothetical protein ACRDQ5_08235 [Sciscionella sp.]